MNHDPSEDEVRAQLLELHLNQCPAEEARQLRAKILTDSGLQQLDRDLANTFSAIRLLPAAQAPEDLLQKTLERVRAAQRTSALITREEAGRPGFTPSFSWREVAGVVAAFVILGVILVPSLRQARDRAYRNECAAKMNEIGMALNSYANDNAGYLPVASNHEYRWLSDDKATAVSNSSALYKLIQGAHASPASFQCPAVGGKSFTLTSNMNDFPSAETVSYSYQHPLSGQGALRLGQLPPQDEKQMAILADDTPLFHDAAIHGELIQPERAQAAVSENHRRTGQNVLYMDSRAGWSPSPAAGVRGNNIYIIDGKYEYLGNEKPDNASETFLLPAYSAHK